jgi:hypothetical protein
MEYGLHGMIRYGSIVQVDEQREGQGKTDKTPGTGLSVGARPFRLHLWHKLCIEDRGQEEAHRLYITINTNISMNSILFKLIHGYRSHRHVGSTHPTIPVESYIPHRTWIWICECEIVHLAHLRLDGWRRLDRSGV